MASVISYSDFLSRRSFCLVLGVKEKVFGWVREEGRNVTGVKAVASCRKSAARSKLKDGLLAETDR